MALNWPLKNWPGYNVSLRYRKAVKIYVVAGICPALSDRLGKDLGRWESLEMVQRCTRSVTFQDSLKFYKAPLGSIDNPKLWSASVS